MSNIPTTEELTRAKIDCTALDSKESALKEAYNKYIDAMVSYLDEVNKLTAENKLNGIEVNVINKGCNYITDNCISHGFNDFCTPVKAADIDKILSKKIE
ncbi:hypothetical protein [uncultured Clostridium sp.]|uniref:hypothetical protein n=1 Tax=uncultured Clostridium sp. TaxID=59620 RepID=UPI0025E8E086|nr:hypothetical protein [uncultured Clostridium sp.]